MLAGLAADLLVLIHFSFIIFVVLGGLLLLRWFRLIWLHLPAVVWGAWIEFTNGVCPLTPLEQELRSAAGTESYSGSFIDHYIVPLIYPPGFDQSTALLLGMAVIVINVLFYGLLYRKARRTTTKI